MIGWFVKDGAGDTRDYWSTSHADPELDSVSNLFEQIKPKFDSETGKMTFLTRRKLDTSDSDQDYIAQIGTQIPMVYGYKKGTSDWVKHDEYGVWSLKIEDRFLNWRC